MPVRIGIPRTLAYYAYYPWWKTFFEGLGLEVIASDPTTKGILDAGVVEAVNDACIPIKLFHGHIMDLKDKVDYIFVPRLVSVRRFSTETFCPKFLGLPDLIRASTVNLPQLIDTRVDLARSRLELFNICRELGRKFGAGFWTVTRAYWKAQRVFNCYEKLLIKQLTPVEAIESLEGNKVIDSTLDNPQLSFAVLGYPYAVYDRFINVDLIKKLRSMGVRVVTAEMIPPQHLLREAKQLPKNLFWHFSNRVMHATSYFLNREKVDGIIHITAFGCGPDAMVDRMMELAAKKQGRVPFLSVTIDEHTGEGGIQTRLEAFVDMLKRRRGLE
jgi:predicted nucleotide-binding protein (sugar kinase/HSP70/actin superfamily)